MPGDIKINDDGVQEKYEMIEQESFLEKTKNYYYILVNDLLNNN